MREEGATYVVTSHGKPVAKIVPFEANADVSAHARETLLDRLKAAPVRAGRALEARGSLQTREMKIALDTNVLAYAEGVNDAKRRDAALEIVARLPQDAIVVPVQGARRALHRAGAKGGARRRVGARCRARLARCVRPGRDVAGPVLLAAMDLRPTTGLSIWDAIVLAAAAQAG